MSPHEKPEKRKPDKAKSETTPERLRPGLERRLRAAKLDKNPSTSKSISIKELTATAKSAKHKFTLAALEIVEYAYIERTQSSDEAVKLASAVEREIAAQLRQEDLVSNLGSGKFFVYLPETAKVESTMVLERLSRHICKRTQKRTNAPQISLTYKFVPAEKITEEIQQHTNSIEEAKFQDWLRRYQFTRCTATGAACESIVASDFWRDSRNVLIKRFNLQTDLEQAKQKRITKTLLSIQENGLALFPRLFDFYIGDNYLCLVLEPSSQYPDEEQVSTRAVHSLLIAICDLFLNLELASIVPPNLSESKFKISPNEQDITYDSLEEHLINALLADSTEDQQAAKAKSFESFAKLVRKLSDKVGEDECFSELEKQLKTISFNKNVSNVLQKHRATLKRHEERLRRTQSSSLEGGK